MTWCYLDLFNYIEHQEFKDPGLISAFQAAFQCKLEDVGQGIAAINWIHHLTQVMLDCVGNLATDSYSLKIFIWLCQFGEKATTIAGKLPRDEVFIKLHSLISNILSLVALQLGKMSSEQLNKESKHVSSIIKLLKISLDKVQAFFFYTPLSRQDRDLYKCILKNMHKVNLDGLNKENALKLIDIKLLFIVSLNGSFRDRGQKQELATLESACRRQKTNLDQPKRQAASQASVTALQGRSVSSDPKALAATLSVASPATSPVMKTPLAPPPAASAAAVVAHKRHASVPAAVFAPESRQLTKQPLVHEELKKERKSARAERILARRQQEERRQQARIMSYQGDVGALSGKIEEFKRQQAELQQALAGWDEREQQQLEKELRAERIALRRCERRKEALADKLTRIRESQEELSADIPLLQEAIRNKSLVVDQTRQRIDRVEASTTCMTIDKVSLINQIGAVYSTEAQLY